MRPEREKSKPKIGDGTSRTLGSATVRIFESKGSKFKTHLVRYYFGGKRIEKRFGRDRAKAEAFASEVLSRLNDGTGAVLGMDAADQASYVKARELLTPFGRSVESGALELVEILKLAGKDSPVEMIRAHRKHYPVDFVVKSIHEVAVEMYAAKRADGRTEHLVRNLQVRIGKIEKQFGENTPIRDLNGVAISDWIRSLKLSAKTKNNYRASLQTLVNFAKSKKYLAPEFSEMTYVPAIPADDDGEIEIYSPGELVKLLNASRGGLFRFIAFGAFAGLRSAEISRLQWENVREDGIEIGKKIAKTASRRIAPMLPALAKIMKGHPTTGKIWKQKKENLQGKTLKYLKQRSGVAWKRNALRHSFISYRLAIVKDAAKVALECGTSPAKIFSNYRQLVTESDAKKWFACDKLVTSSPEKIFEDRFGPVKQG